MARKFYIEAAKYGFSPAMGDAGQMLLDGEGGPADPDLAVRYLQSGADMGDRYSLSLLGWMRATGTHVEADPIEARRLFGIAAAMGDPSALGSLGNYARDGIGGPQDLALAERRLRAALNGGLLAAGSDMAALELLLDNGPRGEARTLAWCHWATERFPASAGVADRTPCDARMAAATDTDRAVAAHAMGKIGLPEDPTP